MRSHTWTRCNVQKEMFIFETPRSKSVVLDFESLVYSHPDEYTPETTGYRRVTKGERGVGRKAPDGR